MVRKISLPMIICELTTWRLDPDGKAVTGTVFASRKPSVAVDGTVRKFEIYANSHYGTGPDGGPPFFLFKLKFLLGDYVKCFDHEQADYPEALKALLSKPKGAP